VVADSLGGTRVLADLGRRPATQTISETIAHLERAALLARSFAGRDRTGGTARRWSHPSKSRGGICAARRTQ
jgi:hypothetical protein